SAARAAPPLARASGTSSASAARAARHGAGRASGWQRDLIDPPKSIDPRSIPDPLGPDRSDARAGGAARGGRRLAPVGPSHIVGRLEVSGAGLRAPDRPRDRGEVPGYTRRSGRGGCPSLRLLW